jgi:long-chain fatty acid transport protein
VRSSLSNAWVSDGHGGLEPLPSHPLASTDLGARNGRAQSEGTGGLAAIGLVKHLAGDKLVFGFYAALPTTHLQEQSAFYSDEREQYFSNSLHFELFGDRMAMSTFAGAIAMRVLPWMAIGAGFSAAIETTATTPVYVPDGSNYAVVLLDSDVQVSTNLAPHAGMTIDVHPRLRLGLTLHTASSVEVDGRNHIKVSNTQSGDQVFRFTHGYDPLSVGAGAAWDLVPGKLALTGTALWRQWSSYRDRHDESPADAWADTVSFALGMRWRHRATLLRADATWVPSPVPDQTGRSNYVDNDRLAFGGGFEWSREVTHARLRAGLLVQAHYLFDRKALKDANAPHPVVDEFPDGAVDPQADPSRPLPEAAGLQTNNPGYPGFSSSGWLVAGGATLALDF